MAPVADRAKQLGFAPVKLGRLNEVARWCTHAAAFWARLIFRDLFKKEQ